MLIFDNKVVHSDIGAHILKIIQIFITIGI